MQVRVLGPLEMVSGDGQTVSLEGIQGRLLGRLVLSANQVVPADRLIEDLWEGSPPPTALATLRTHISQAAEPWPTRKESSRRQAATAWCWMPVSATSPYSRPRWPRRGAWSRKATPAAGAASFADALGLWRGPVLACLPTMWPGYGPAPCALMTPVWWPPKSGSKLVSLPVTTLSWWASSR